MPSKFQRFQISFATELGHAWTLSGPGFPAELSNKDQKRQVMSSVCSNRSILEVGQMLCAPSSGGTRPGTAGGELKSPDEASLFQRGGNTKPTIRLDHSTVVLRHALRRARGSAHCSQPETWNTYNRTSAKGWDPAPLAYARCNGAKFRHSPSMNFLVPAQHFYTIAFFRLFFDDPLQSFTCFYLLGSSTDRISLGWTVGLVGV